jgi:hypothetical protein
MRLLGVIGKTAPEVICHDKHFSSAKPPNGLGA